jgi:hypothetical protein
LNDIRERIAHITPAGRLETQDAFEERLVRFHDLTPLPLIPEERDWDEAVNAAYDRQSEGIAYREREWPTEELAS